MGRIIKYNIAKGDGGQRVKTVVNGGSSNNMSYPSATPSTDGNSNSSNISVEIWGQHFNGKRDVDGDMIVNGDVTIGFDPDDYDPEAYEDEDGNEVLPSGKLTVQDTATARELIAKERIFLPYPTTSDQPQDLAPLIKTFDDKIDNLNGRVTTVEGRMTTVENTVANLSARVSTAETNIESNTTAITNLQTNVTNCHQQCMTNASDISNLKDIIEQLQKQIEDLTKQPEPTTTYDIKFVVNNTIQSVKVEGNDINETINQTKTFSVEKGITLNYTATAADGYTFGNKYSARVSTKSDSVVADGNKTITPEAFQWLGDNPSFESLINVQVGAYNTLKDGADAYDGEWQIWLRVTSEYPDEMLTFSILAPELGIDGWESNTGSKHDFGGSPTITRENVINRTPVKQPATFLTREWPDPTAKHWQIQFSQGASKYAIFSGEVIRLTSDPSFGDWN